MFFCKVLGTKVSFFGYTYLTYLNIYDAIRSDSSEKKWRSQFFNILLNPELYTASI